MAIELKLEMKVSIETRNLLNRVYDYYLVMVHALKHGLTHQHHFSFDSLCWELEDSQKRF
jgi:hypothetical protein